MWTRREYVKLTDAERMWDIWLSMDDLDIALIGIKCAQDLLLVLPDPRVDFRKIQMKAMTILLK